MKSFGKVPSQLLAFCLLWSQLFDSLLFLAFISHTLSEYTNLLFRGAIQSFFHVSNPVDILSTDHFDIFSLIAILLTASLLCCSLQVLVTVVLVFLITLFFTLTSTTIVALMQNFAQLRFLQFGFSDNYEPFFHSIECLLLLLFCLECIGFLAEESEQPHKFLPWTFRTMWKVSGMVMALAIIAFYPFQNLIHFHAKFLIPNVFAHIGIYSARYFMNVGSICGLCGTLIVSFIPPTRILYTLAQENLLPIGYLKKLHGKEGVPRNAVILVGLISTTISIFPKTMLLNCIPVNVSLRLFCQSLLLYKEYFSSEKLEFHEAKYNRLRMNLTGFEGISNYSFDYSTIPSEGEEDTDAEILKRMREVNQTFEESELVCCQKTNKHKYDSIMTDDNGNFSSSSIAHECFLKSCTTDKNIEENLPQGHYHIYETDATEKPYKNQSNGVEKNLLDPISAEKSSKRLLVTFMLGALLVATSFKVFCETIEFIPILSIIGMTTGLLMSALAFILVGRLKVDNRNRFQPLGYLAMIFLLTIILFHFSLLKYGIIIGWIMIGTIFYIFNIICNQ